jgi:8-oxo-dGTP pyrophosphatase MutT (NUDIX family)
MAVMELLSKSLEKIRSTPPRMIASPPTQPRRAAVAIIIRVVSSHPKPSILPSTLSDFFEQDWVKDPTARPEILFLKRDNTQDGHLAFPGGRMEDGDEGSLFTAMRQTWEEIGIDLAEKDFMCVGQLDDREITTSLGKRLLMILSPFVFLHLSPIPPTPDPLPATSLHWTPIFALIAPTKWSFVSVDAASRLAPKNSVILRILVRLLVGTMRFPAIVLHDSSAETQPFIPHSILEKGIRPPPPPPSLKLWGLSLGMVLDLLSFMGGPDQEKNHLPALPFQESMGTDLIPPSLASVFPRFSYPDVNFWIWLVFISKLNKYVI